MTTLCRDCDHEATPHGRFAMWLDRVLRRRPTCSASVVDASGWPEPCMCAAPVHAR